MCLSPSSSDKHTKSSPCTAILTSWFALGNTAALCLPLRKRIVTRNRAAIEAKETHFEHPSKEKEKEKSRNKGKELNPEP